MTSDILSNESKTAIVRLGENIRQARLARSWSETEVAKRALISRGTLRKIELGSPTVSIEMYAQALDLFGLVEQIGLLGAPHTDEEGTRIRLKKK